MKSELDGAIRSMLARLDDFAPLPPWYAEVTGPRPLRSRQPRRLVSVTIVLVLIAGGIAVAAALRRSDSDEVRSGPAPIASGTATTPEPTSTSTVSDTTVVPPATATVNEGPVGVLTAEPTAEDAPATVWFIEVQGAEPTFTVRAVTRTTRCANGALVGEGEACA